MVWVQIVHLRVKIRLMLAFQQKTERQKTGRIWWPLATAGGALTVHCSLTVHCLANSNPPTFRTLRDCPAHVNPSCLDAAIAQ